jgi:hypothetical protein
MAWRAFVAVLVFVAIVRLPAAAAAETPDAVEQRLMAEIKAQNPAAEILFAEANEARADGSSFTRSASALRCFGSARPGALALPPSCEPANDRLLDRSRHPR